MRAFLTGGVAIALSALVAVSAQAQGEDLKVFGSRTVTRIGVVVNDVDAAAKAYSDAFGVEVSPARDVKVKFPTNFKGDRGAYTRVAAARFDNMIVELIQPMGGASPWKDFLTANGQAIYQVSFNVPALESHVRLLESKGGTRIVGAPGDNFAVVNLMPQIGVNIALHEGKENLSYIAMRKPDARASGGIDTVARLGILGPNTDERRKAFADIFGITVADPTDERGLTFPEGFTGDKKSGMRHIFVPFNNMWMNVIQPLGGESPWKWMVDNHQHYLFFGVDDVEATAQKLAALGGQRTLGAAGGSVAYMNMKDQLGLTVFLLKSGILPQ